MTNTNKTTRRNSFLIIKGRGYIIFTLITLLAFFINSANAQATGYVPSEKLLFYAPII
jgi:hypothetical protein